MGYATSHYRKVEPARLEQREAVRQPVLLQRATVRGNGKDCGEARLVDLSVYGCRLVIAGKFRSGDKLWLRFGSYDPIAATAIWFEDNRLGCRFDAAINRTLFRELTQLTG